MTDIKPLEERSKAFNEKLIPLLGEFKVGLGATAFITADGRISARPYIFDDSKEKETPKEEGTTDQKAEESTAENKEGGVIPA